MLCIKLIRYSVETALCANQYQLATPKIGESAEQKGPWSSTRPFFTVTKQKRKKRSGDETTAGIEVQYCICYFANVEIVVAVDVGWQVVLEPFAGTWW